MSRSGIPIDRFSLRQGELHVDVEPALFAWRGGEIVLFGERTDDRWRLARGWRSADRLTDVRRWSFATPERFVAQVRRLAWEAVLDPSRAAAAAAAAADWVAFQIGGSSRE
jgi:hypothetical protein